MTLLFYPSFRRTTATHRPRSVALAGIGCIGLALGCLPEDTRPPPTEIRTSLVVVDAEDDDPSDGVTFTTADDYEVELERIRMSFGRVVFEGPDCNMYARGQGVYSRVMNPLQSEPQPVSLNYALGQCAPHFRLYPPEDWAHAENPGVSAADRQELRAEEFPDLEVRFGREQLDDFVGPRGPAGATLIVSGVGREQATGQEVPFRLAFGVPSFVPWCTPPGESEFNFGEDGFLSLIVEMMPQQLFGTCGSDELRFAPVARTQAALGAGEVVTLDTLRDVQLSELSETGEAEFYACDRSETWAQTLAERSEAGDEPEMAEGALAPPTTLRAWFNTRVYFDLFDVRDADCRSQPPTFVDGF